MVTFARPASSLLLGRFDEALYKSQIKSEILYATHICVLHACIQTLLNISTSICIIFFSGHDRSIRIKVKIHTLSLSIIIYKSRDFVVKLELVSGLHHFRSKTLHSNKYI